jgi:16S rRNA G966 N2-methylase RsmD
MIENLNFEKIIFGDSVIFNADAYDILPSLDDGSIDICLTDMPYAAESFGSKCTACEWDTPINLVEFWRWMERKAKPSANFVLFCNMKLAFDLIGSNMKGFRSDLVWCKNNRVGFLNSNNQVLRSHENILLFRRPRCSGAATYNAIKVSGGRPRVNRAKARTSGGVYPAGEAYTTISDGTMNPISVLAFDHDRGNGSNGFHPTQKPLNLLGYLLMLYSNENDLVLEPFAGSGTTACAAMKLGRRFIAIEREKSYYDIACQRLNEIWQRKTARRLTYISLPDNPVNVDQTAPEAESTIPSAPETERQNCEAPKPTEDVT